MDAESPQKSVSESGDHDARPGAMDRGGSLHLQTIWCRAMRCWKRRWGRRTRVAGLPSIDVAPNQGKLLYLLALMKGAKRILEVSTLWAGAAPSPGWQRCASCKWTTCSTPWNWSRSTPEVARGNLERAREAKKVEIRVGAALDLLIALHEEGAGTVRPDRRCGIKKRVKRISVNK